MTKRDRLHHWAIGITFGVVVIYLLLLVVLVRDSLPALSWAFIVRPPEELRPGGGVGPELLNTLSMVGLALGILVPLALGVSVATSEHYRGHRWIDNVTQLSRVFISLPGVVIGLVAYRILIAQWGWPLSVMSGVLVLVVMNWPLLATIAGDAFRAVPETVRDASLALGATEVQTWRRAVLPSSLPELASGLGLVAARMVGESAALIFTAGVNVAPHWGLWAPGETLAVHLWYIRTEGLMPDAAGQAAATGVILVVLVAGILWVTQKLATWLKDRH